MNYKFIFWALMAGLLFGSCQSNDHIEVVKRPPNKQKNNFYIESKAPLQAGYFIKLPIGNVKPEGWIREYLERERDGMTGHLDEISKWLDKDNNAWLNAGNKNGWEEVPYWLKGYSVIGYLLEDSTMIHESEKWISAVLKSQRDDGYFGPVNKHDNGNYDLWPNMIMLWCLQSYYEYSGDQRVIDLMTNYFGWELKVPDDQFLEGYWEQSRGGDNLYSVYWLYNRTGEKWLLDLAKKIHRNTSDWEQKSNLPNWHNVNIAQGFREPATFFMQTGDTTDLQSTYRDFHLIRAMYGQVPGGMFGGDENSRPGHTDPHQAIETCGMVEQMTSDEMLLRMTGDPFWGDHAEEVAFNTYPAAVMPDFKALRYLTAPNMVVSDSKDHSPGIQNGGPFFTMNPLSSRCCQHNHSQGWPYYAESMVAATHDNGLVVLLYSSSSTRAKVGDGTEITLHEQSHYPFEEQITFKVETPEAADFPLYLRVPRWCHNANLTINGEKKSVQADSSSYIRIERSWKQGDTVGLTLPMNLWVQKWEKNKNSVSVNYGPLTFSLKIDERYKKVSPKETAIHDSGWQQDASINKWPAYEIYPDSPWNYALILNKQDPASSFKVTTKAWPDDDFPFTIDDTPIEIKATGKRLPGWDIDDHGLVEELPPSPVKTDQPEEDITLVPMGAARLRISAFPVTP